jgi:signal peptidase
MHRPSNLVLARWLVDGALLLVIAAVVAAVVGARVLPAVGVETLTITGRSMAPTIPMGSVVVLEPVAGTTGIGEIVSVEVPGGPTYTHRVVEVVARPDGPWLRTKGDANASPDPSLVDADWVIGQVDVTVPALGFMVRLLSVPSGLLTVLSMSILLFTMAMLLEDLEWERRARNRRDVAATLAAAGPSPSGMAANATTTAPARAVERS